MLRALGNIIMLCFYLLLVLWTNALLAPTYLPTYPPTYLHTYLCSITICSTRTHLNAKPVKIYWPTFCGDIYIHLHGGKIMLYSHSGMSLSLSLTQHSLSNIRCLIISSNQASLSIFIKWISTYLCTCDHLPFVPILLSLPIRGKWVSRWVSR